MQNAYCKICLVLVFTFLNTYTCFSQSGSVLGSEFVEKNNYLKAVDTIETLLKKYNKAHGFKFGHLNNSELDQALSLYKSFIGEEYKIRYKRRKPLRSNSSTTQFTLAIPYIAKQAANRSIVMINEDHTVPKHRLLTYNLLDTLYKLGYRYLAAETLTPNDSSQLNLKYPGAYTPEPNMANMLKKAIKLGFKLIAYESQDTTAYNSKQPFYADNLRELEQARNLYEIFVKDPKAKVLVHAGHGHIWKQTQDDLIPMAKYFSVISGINPLCVNQSITSPDEFAAKLTTSKIQSDLPYIVLDDNSKPLVSTYDEEGSYDVLVAWPRSKVINGRYDYLLAKANTKQYNIKVTNNDVGHLLQIISLADGDDIPVDQFVVKPNIDQYTTKLEVGMYLMQLIDRNGVIVSKKQINIK
jgi:hypothetical protein